jgi:hypothetical protein
MARAKLRPSVGVLAEYETADAMLAALRALRAAGYTRLDIYTPYPIHGSDEALGLPRSKLPYIAFAAGMLGAAGAYLLQWWMNAVDYPLNVGGRPAHAAPAFIIITFEMGVLFAALAAFLSVFAFAKLPELWHPLFEVPGFERATIDRFWLSVDTDDPHFGKGTRDVLQGTSPLQVVFL